MITTCCICRLLCLSGLFLGHSLVVSGLEEGIPDGGAHDSHQNLIDADLPGALDHAVDEDGHGVHADQAGGAGHQAQGDGGPCKDQGEDGGDDKGDQHGEVQHQGHAVDQGLVDIEDAAGQDDLGKFLVALGLGKQEHDDHQAQGAAAAAVAGEVIHGGVPHVGDGQAGCSGSGVFGQVSEPQRVEDSQHGVGAVDAEEPEDLSQQQQDDKAAQAAGDVGQRGLEQGVDGVDDIAPGGQGEQAPQQAGHQGDSSPGDDGSEALGDILRDAGRHFDGDVPLHQGNVDLGGHDAQDEGQEYAVAAQVVQDDDGTADLVGGHGHHDQVGHQGHKAVVEGHLIVAENLSPGVAHTEHHEHAHEVHAGIVDGVQEGRDSCRLDEALVGVNLDAVQQIEHCADHDDGHQVLGACADAADVSVLGECGGDGHQCVLNELPDGIFLCLRHGKIPPSFLKRTFWEGSSSADSLFLLAPKVYHIRHLIWLQAQLQPFRVAVSISRFEKQKNIFAGFCAI